MDRKEVIDSISKANDMIAALCQPKGSEGAREWIMSIPARPDHDPDLIISRALSNAAAFITAQQHLTNNKSETLYICSHCQGDPDYHKKAKICTDPECTNYAR